MRKFLFKFVAFLAALEGVRHLQIELLLLGAGTAMALIACAHFVAGPAHDGAAGAGGSSENPG